MNILIFTGRFGMGHVAAAQALAQQVRRQAPTARVRVVDVIQDLCPHLARVVYGGFDFTVHYCAGVYNLLNKWAGQVPCTPAKGTAIQRLAKLMEEEQPDLVLSTLPLSSQYLAAYRKATGSRVPFYTYITDLSAHREWLAPGTDCYFVADESTRLQLLAAGVPSGDIVVSGIPVREEFALRAPRPEVSRRPKVLVMGGGLGLLPKTQGLFQALAEDGGADVTVIAGRNEALAAGLREAYPAFNVVGFTDRVADYLTQADLLVTKAGGITTFEALRANTPLCLLPPFLTQEEANAQYIARNGFGRVLPAGSGDGEALLSLLHDREELRHIRRRMAVALRTLDPTTALDRFLGQQEAAC
jgi:UDP-N-acetylglucosamine:LPS N-acetylglucosamine transferase